MTNQDLGTASLVSTATKGNCVFIEVNGSVRRITIDDLINVLNTGDELLLRQVAWGVPCKQNQTSQSWGVVGNTGMFEEYVSMIGRYLVTNDGKAAKLLSTNSAIFADGTTLDESKGHVMVIAPRLYYIGKTEAASGVTYAWFSMLPIGGYYLGNCNNDQYLCIGSYLGSMAGSALVSRSGLIPSSSKNIQTFWNAAQVNGQNWGLVNNDHCKFMLWLALSKYGNPNIQTQLGYGVCGSSSISNSDFVNGASKLYTGATKSLGDSCGSIAITQYSDTIASVSDSSHVNLFGVEDWYNWFWQFIQGVYFGSSANPAQNGSEIFIYSGNRMPTETELSTHPSGNYRQLVRVTSPTEGFIKELILGDHLDIFLKSIGGGSTSHWGDYSLQNGTGQVLAWGGTPDYGEQSGISYARTDNPWSFSGNSYASRIAYYGPLTFMSGKELMTATA